MEFHSSGRGNVTPMPIPLTDFDMKKNIELKTKKKFT
jgi:hypothetical protein